MTRTYTGARVVFDCAPTHGGRGHAFATEAEMLTILIIVLVLALLGGGFGHGKFGPAGWSPAAIIAVILIFMLVTHRL